MEALLRELAPQVLGSLLRRFRDFEAAEDAVQEALLAASVQWPREGTPDNPRGWLIEVASRRLVDQVRSAQARQRREDQVAAEIERLEDRTQPSPGRDGEDETLILLVLCCHPSLTPPSAIALTLRAVGGLSTAEVAHAFLVPEATMAQRISRAKQTVKASGAVFEMPAPAEWAERMRSLLHVLYLMFNEGYASSVGPDLLREELTGEAIRLTRIVQRLRPEDAEVAGLLALMLLTDARRPARTGPDGDLIPLAEQDRSLWDKETIAEGVALVTSALSRGAVGPYQLQAAIAAIHDEAPRAEATDWPQILAFYTLLEHMTDNPMVMLNRAIALAMVQGAHAGLERLGALDADGRLTGHHRLHAVRGHLLEMSGEYEGARAAYEAAAAGTSSLPERRYLLARASRLA